MELKTISSVEASNVELKRMSVYQLMSHSVKSEGLKQMFSNLNVAKLAAIGLLLPISTMDCEREFSAMTSHHSISTTILSSLRSQHSHESVLWSRSYWVFHLLKVAATTLLFFGLVPGAISDGLFQLDVASSSRFNTLASPHEKLGIHNYWAARTHAHTNGGDSMIV